MLALQLLVNGLVTGSALGLVAISFSLIYSTTKIFHVAHAGIYTTAGYISWALARSGMPDIISLAGAILVCVCLGAAIQYFLYARLEQRRAICTNAKILDCGLQGSSISYLGKVWVSAADLA